MDVFWVHFCVGGYTTTLIYAFFLFGGFIRDSLCHMMGFHKTYSSRKLTAGGPQNDGPWKAGNGTLKKLHFVRNNHLCYPPWKFDIAHEK